MTGRSRQGGLTLAEFMVVVAILGILATLAQPSLAEIVERRRLESAAHAVGTDLRFARSQAIALNRSIHLTFSVADDGGSCVITTAAGTTPMEPLPPCRCTAGGSTLCPYGIEPLRTTHLLRRYNISLQSNVQRMSFDPINGTVTPTGTIRLSNRRGQQIVHILNIIGRTRSCTDGVTLPQLPHC